jgi:hypothetical protein
VICFGGEGGEVCSPGGFCAQSGEGEEVRGGEPGDYMWDDGVLGLVLGEEGGRDSEDGD